MYRALTRVPVLILVVLLCCGRAAAWNRTGHAVIAHLAYQRLQPATRARVDALLQQHPDYSTWVQDVPSADRAAIAFERAASWPDDIRNDARFSSGKRSTPQLPGFPATGNQRHEEWHYINVPFTTDNTRLLPPALPNVLTTLQDFQALATFGRQQQMYVLPWLLHLVGDVHQPLHTLTLFRKDLPKGDRGGNSIQLKSGNLHTYWDSRIGSSTTARFIAQTAATISIMFPAPAQLSLDPKVWVNESVNERTIVYGFAGTGTKHDPAILSDAYAVGAKQLSLQRAALAAYRLAALLNQYLR